MKKATILAAICMTLISLSSFAQPGGGGGMSGGRGGMGGGQGQGQGMQPQQQRSLDINFIGAAGYFVIDSDEVLGKLKIKKDKAKQEAIVATINIYISSCQDLIDTNRTDIDNLEFAKENLETAEGDMDAMRKIMMSVNESMRAVRPMLVKNHKELTKSMTALLNEKELKRWTKYYKSICNKNNFDPDARERQSRMPQRGEDGEDGERPEGPPPMM